MTNIEQQFFKVFGIEPKYQDACTVEDKYWQNEELANKYGTFDMYMNAKCGNQENCTTQCSCAYTKEIYPEITAEKLLELICILNTITNPDLGDINVGRLKLSVLEQCIEALKKVDWQNRIPTKNEYIDEVRALFEGEE